MIHIEEFLWCFSIISFCFHLLHGFTRVFYMTLTCNPSSSSSPPTLPWMHFCSPLPVMNGGKTRALKNYSRNRNQEVDSKSIRQEEVRNTFCFEMKGSSEEKSPSSNSREVVKVSTKAWKRPSRISIPKPSVVTDFGDVGEVLDNKDFEVQGRDFFLASRRGRRAVMEDGFSVITDILGDPKQSFYGVFDGHGGRAAVDYATENLGKNIVVAIGEVGEAEGQVEQAIRNGYLTTDKDFLSKGQCSGVCVATVILKDGELYVANAGDCRVVLSRKGVGDALTSDHRVNREDELFRIQNLGGYVSCRNGVWRAQDSLAVSRAIGDLSLKELIISEPEIKKLHLTSDCDFLIVASDGLWDKVSNQEAVDVVSRHKITLESCKKLVDMSSSRGSKDDTTVMVINLQNFVRSGEPP
ncbi:probable protein phosphatase 2C 74 [Macadamia integrifolia]|uniref:probable protein phosphatase 2C 74 n=1 Tax=Macadamia integrifolia TaxID=60698 RepID=UPI001C4EA415|nr:probable protein phosphatase 2C 74 [Macadamia integrifolia]